MDSAFCHSQGDKNVFEHLTGEEIAAFASAPAIDHSLIVSKNLKMKVGGTRMEDHKDEELKIEALYPANVLYV